MPRGHQTLRVNLIEARALMSTDKNGLSDPYVVFWLESDPKKSKAKSKVIKKTLDPEWNQTFYFAINADSGTVAEDNLCFEVYDHDQLSADDLVGKGRLSLNGLKRGIESLREVPIGGKQASTLHLTMNALDFDTYGPPTVAAAGTSSSSRLRSSAVGVLRVTVKQCRNLIPMDRGGTSDPFVTLRILDKTRVQRTSIIHKTLDPVWADETFDFDVDTPSTDQLKVSVYDFDKWKTNDFLGEASLPCLVVTPKDITKKQRWSEWLPLLGKWQTTKKRNHKERGDILLDCTWYPIRPSGEGYEHDDDDGGDAAAGGKNKADGDVLPDGRPTPLKPRWEIKHQDLDKGKTLGSGNFGVVYLGKWRLQQVAIKELRAELAGQDLEDFRREASIMMNLRPHKNVVQLMGVCLENPLCIVTEFVESGSLERLLKSSAQLNWLLILKVIRGVCAGMHHLHEEGILHRDLAARNILLGPDATPQIADFGLSQQMHADIAKEEEVKVQDEKAGKDTATPKAFRGPYKYMAPESLRSLAAPVIEFSVKTDVWSYGVLVNEVMTRHDPFPELGLFQAAHNIAYKGLRLPIPPTTPTKFKELMLMCWRDDPAERPTFAEIDTLLQSVQDEVHTY